MSTNIQYNANTNKIANNKYSTLKTYDRRLNNDLIKEVNNPQIDT